MAGVGVRAIIILAAAIFLGSPPCARAQDMEPRAYSNAPIGLNFLIAGYAYTRGGALIDSSLPVTNPDLTTNSAILAYGRVLDLWGQSAKLNIIVPYTGLTGTAQFAGHPMTRDVSGFADPAFKLSVNLYGAPALSLKKFASYEQDLIVGASLRVTAPLGQYDDTKAVNVGTNRWSFKPEIGVSKALGPWTLEATAAATLYTDNTNFFHGNTISQDPLYSAEGHVIYSFGRGIWGSLDATYFTGGRTTLNGVLRNPRVSGNEITYDVTVISGTLPKGGGPASLFIDVIGLPFTPLSFAGVARRTAYRTAVYGGAVASPYYYNPYPYAPYYAPPAAFSNAPVVPAPVPVTYTAPAPAPVFVTEPTQNPPPIGTVVSALPPGCVSSPRDGIQYFDCAGVYYRAAIQGESIRYMVVQQP